MPIALAFLMGVVPKTSAGQEAVAAAGTAVASPKALLAALERARGGETVLLAPGTYQNVVIRNCKFGEFVTLKPADAAHPPVVASIVIQSSDGLRLDGLVFARALTAEEPWWTRIVRVEQSRDIEFVGNTFRGSVDGDHEERGNWLPRP